MNELTQAAKAEAMRLAMRIDLGELDNQFILSCIKKDKNT